MYCQNCGNRIDDDALFCQKCGHATGNAPRAQAGSGGKFLLTVCRENQWFLINPPIDITVDGREKYAVQNGQQISIPLTPGGHTIQFSKSIRKTVIQVNMQQNLTVVIKWNRVTGEINVNY